MNASASPTSGLVVEFNALFDDEDGIGLWTARSEAEGMTTEAATKAELLQRLSVIVPDVMESRTGRAPENLHIFVNWQELRIVERTESAGKPRVA